MNNYLKTAKPTGVSLRGKLKQHALEEFKSNVTFAFDLFGGFVELLNGWDITCLIL